MIVVIFVIDVSADSIGYQIISEAEPIIHSCYYPIQSFLHRNCVALHRNRVCVAHLNTSALPVSPNIVLIPYCLHTLSNFEGRSCAKFVYFDFEFRSHLESVGRFAFQGSSAASIFIPHSARLIGSSDFGNCGCALCLFFDPDSSLEQFKSDTFSSFSSLGDSDSRFCQANPRL
jgi:hypothetical protein